MVKKLCKHSIKNISRYQVSVAFLLFGNDPIQLKRLVDKLLNLDSDEWQYRKWGVLTLYVKTRSDWKAPVLAALTVAGAHAALMYWGVDYYLMTDKLWHTDGFVRDTLGYISNWGGSENMVVCLLRFKIFQAAAYISIQESGTISSLWKMFSMNWSLPATEAERDITLIRYLRALSYQNSDPTSYEAYSYHNKMKNDERACCVYRQMPRLMNYSIVRSALKLFGLGRSEERTKINLDSVVQHLVGNRRNFILRPRDNHQTSQTVNASKPSNVCTAVYSISKELAGYILIIDEENYWREGDPTLRKLLPREYLEHRTGSAKDSELLAQTFERLGYVPIIKRDIDHEEVKIATKDVVRMSDGYDSLIVCILAHGTEGKVYASNSIPICISEIEEILTTGDTLYYKPKILIIQACQGYENQHYKEERNTNRIQPNQASAANLVVFQSAYKGFYSIRNTEKGSWFIQLLCWEIVNSAASDSVSKIFTSVTRQVGNRRSKNGDLMQPTLRTTLWYELFFPKV